MGRLGSAVTIAPALFALVASLLGSSRPSAANGAIRFVPQLGLTDLSPARVVFAPDDDTLLMVVNSRGHVDIFNISNPGRPVKITEIAAGARDAAFTPKGTPRAKIKIVADLDQLVQPSMSLESLWACVYFDEPPDVEEG
jgi:hypothetical protein